MTRFAATIVALVAFLAIAGKCTSFDPAAKQCRKGPYCSIVLTTSFQMF
jgi:hypothetical protein